MYLVFFCFPYFIWLFISRTGSQEKSFSMRTDSLLASIVLKIKKDNQKGKKKKIH